jgi:inorganic triphosphatase YgiF
MQMETELKFRVPARGLADLAGRRLPPFQNGRVTRERLVSTYFDSANHKLKRQGLSLRIRQIQDKTIQTVKSSESGHIGRGEWEAEVRGSSPDFEKAADSPLHKFAGKKLQRKLKPAFKTVVRRTTMPLRADQAEIELAIDRGDIVAGRRRVRLSEVELELKRGGLADLFRLARIIERRTGAELFLPSKAERGYDLARRTTTLVRFAEPVVFTADAEVAGALKAIVHSTVRHFADNADAVRALDAEGLHQMRVGLRRTRAAISLFGEILRPASTDRIKSELKWLTDELAPGRELDVFVQERIDPALRGDMAKRGGRALRREFETRRRAAFMRARAAINSSRYRRLLIDLLEWLETGVAPRAEGQEPIEDFAADVLRRRLRKICKDGEHLDALSARERHKLRIKIKKLRYGLEFFDSLIKGKRDRKQAAKLSKKLKALQGALGSLNDLAAHRDMVRDAALHAPLRHRRARAFVAGLILGREDEASKPVLKAAARAIRRLGSAAVL